MTKNIFGSGVKYMWVVGLQLCIRLSSIRDMGSDEPAYRVARFTNFLEPVIVLKVGKFSDKIYQCFKQFLAAIISGEMYVVSTRCASLFLHFGVQ